MSFYRKSASVNCQWNKCSWSYFTSAAKYQQAFNSLSNAADVSSSSFSWSKLSCEHRCNSSSSKYVKNYKHDIYDANEDSMVIQMDENDSSISEESVDVELGSIDNNEDTFINTCSDNVQRKPVTYRETWIDRQMCNSLSDKFIRWNTVIMWKRMCILYIFHISIIFQLNHLIQMYVSLSLSKNGKRTHHIGAIHVQLKYLDCVRWPWTI